MKDLDLSDADQLEPAVVFEFPDQDSFRRRDIECVPRPGDLVMHNQRIYLVASVTWNITHTALVAGVR